jgi:hypothetical protein
VVWVLIGLLMFWIIIRWGINLLHGMTQPLPAPPPEGEMRRVNVRYRCSICGVELRMTLAAEQDPPPPRHCMEDMDLVAPIE